MPPSAVFLPWAMRHDPLQTCAMAILAIIVFFGVVTLIIPLILLCLLLGLLLLSGTICVICRLFPRVFGTYAYTRPQRS